MASTPKESFRTHLNYLHAFETLLFLDTPSKHNGIYTNLHKRIESAFLIAAKKRNSVDLEQIKTSLHNSWGTEFLLLTSKRFSEEDEIIRLSNNWNCIQTYYIFYHCTQALIVAKGKPRPESHPKTQKIFYDLWGSRRICLSPWSLASSCDGFLNIPDGIIFDPSIHAWSKCEGENAWNLAGKALMTTRREPLKESERRKREQKRSQTKKSWEEKERKRLAKGKRLRNQPNFPLPRLTKIEKQKINSQHRPFTIMDYLYRLRIKTNYIDSNMFTDGPEDENQSRYVRRYLCRIASATIFLHEIAISKIIGSRIFNAWVSAWIKKNIPSDMKAGLVTRQNMFYK